MEPHPAFERWSLHLAPGVAHATTAAEWADALVVVERGTLRVDCLGGGAGTFVAGDQLALGCLPLRGLRNVGTDDVRIVAVRRCPARTEPHTEPE